MQPRRPNSFCLEQPGEAWKVGLWDNPLAVMAFGEWTALIPLAPPSKSCWLPGWQRERWSLSQKVFRLSHGGSSVKTCLDIHVHELIHMSWGIRDAKEHIGIQTKGCRQLKKRMVSIGWEGKPDDTNLKLMKRWESAEINREQEAEGGAAGTPTSLRALSKWTNKSHGCNRHSLDLGHTYCKREEQTWLHIGSIPSALSFVLYCWGLVLWALHFW